MDIQIQTNQLYTVELAKGVIPGSALKELHSWIYKHDPKLAEYMNSTVSFYGESEWNHWMITTGVRKGTWPVRFRNTMAKYGLKVDPTMLSVIGERIRRYQNSIDNAYLEFVKPVDWKSGDFGDNSSCWWVDGGPAVILRAFNDTPGAYGVKFYESQEAYEKDRTKGISRCWLYVARDRLYTFNAHGDIALNRASLSVAKALNLPQFTEIRLDIASSYTDGNRGYAIGREDDKFPTGYTMQWYAKWREEHEDD